MYTRLSRHPWIKEPFSLGYPGSKTAYEGIKRDLFPELAELKQLAKDQVSRYVPTKYTQPIPQDIAGFDLFNAHVGLRDHRFIKRLWKRLLGADRAYFDHPESREWLYNERIRVWQGYEIVAHLRASADDISTRMNPYALLGLHPWEIIKDKVSLKTPLEDFEVDYYDLVIGQALSRRPSTELDFGYYVKNENSGVYGPLDAQRDHRYFRRAFERMHTTGRLRYLERSQQQKEHYQKLKGEWEKRRHPYNQFRAFHKGGKAAATLTGSATEWNLLSVEERQKYDPKETHLPTSPFHKNQIAQWKTEMVMEYVFGLAGVVGVEKYDWRTDMSQKTRGYHYIRGYYQPRVLLWAREQPFLT